MEEKSKVISSFFGIPFIILHPDPVCVSILRSLGLKANGEKAVLRAHESSCLAALFLIAGQHPEARIISTSTFRKGNGSFSYVCAKASDIERLFYGIGL